jgi:esterase/lipase superfamily enzyme
MQRMDIIIACGKGDPAWGDNQEFSGRLWKKGIGNALRGWEGFAHDWPWWEDMIALYVDGHD